MAATGLHISISAEPIFHLGGLSVTNSILTSLIVSGLLLTFALIVRSQLKQTDRPTGLQNFAEWVIESIIGLIESVTGDKRKTKFFLPWVGTFLLFIMLNNWLGLLPGVGTIGVMKHEESSVEAAQIVPQDISTKIISEIHAADPEQEELVIDQEHNAGEEISDEEVAETEASETEEELAGEESHSEFVPLFRAGTADLNTTIALAIVSVFVTQILGVIFQGPAYFSKFVNFSSPIMFFVGILEIVSEFAKIISFAFRLFGNIFAGEVLLTVISFLVPVIAPLPFYGLEIFVGFIQALVFAMLSLVFYNMATQSHDEH